MVAVTSPLPYPIHVADGLLDAVGELVALHAPAHNYAIVTDENVGPLYAARVKKSFGEGRVHIFTMPAGESAKNVMSWWELSEAMLEAGLGRDTTVLALGGGIVGDVAGFVAASYLRGVPYIQIPTTVVAMVDSSIGGKTGVNARAGKNLIGAFHQPSAIVADPATLHTLPARELRAGLAEVLKHGVIADADYFTEVVNLLPEVIGSGGTSPAFRHIIARSIGIKGEVVVADEYETGKRKILNFGHTVGHAIEALSNYSILHGEAVSIGMCMECAIGEVLGVTEMGTTNLVGQALQLAGLPTGRPPSMEASDIVNAAGTDKKIRAGVLALALPARIGSMAAENDGWTVSAPNHQLQLLLEQIPVQPNNT